MQVGSKRLRFQEHGRRKFVVFIIILCLIAAGIVTTVYAMQRPGGFRELFSGAPAPTATAAMLEPEPTPTPTPIPIVTTAPDTLDALSASDSSSPTSALQSGESDGVAFLGNSNLEDLYVYGLIPDADFFYKVGLTVDKADTDTAEGSDIPILEEVKGKNYEKIFLMFGNNELGWDTTTFLDDYEELIQTVRSEDPNARIYVMGILPITKEVSDQAVEGATQEHIDQLNEELKTLANDNDCYFMDLGLAMKNEDGYLPDSAAEDGVHLNKEYCVRWAEILRNEIGGESG